MATRIAIDTIPDNYPYPHAKRQGKINSKGFNEVFRWNVGSDRIEPIIAKGNRFDKVKAKW